MSESGGNREITGAPDELRARGGRCERSRPCAPRVHARGSDAEVLGHDFSLCHRPMNARPFIIISTRLPPQLCGIGAYSWLLHRHWPGATSHVRFLVVECEAESAAVLKHSAIAEFNAKAANLSRALESAGGADVLLHYAGRAYHRYGCPIWLPEVLAKWKAKYPAGRLLIFFHELPGKFPITSRHYWINLCNRRIIRNLARPADVIVQNTSDHVTKVRKSSGSTDD